MKTILLAAVTLDGFIARSENQISTDWTSKADRHFFRERTMQAGVMVMGRKTFETIGRPLPKRVTIVVSRQGLVDSETYRVKQLEGEISNFKFQISNISDQVVYLTQLPPRELVEKLANVGVQELAVCGGASIYQQFLDAGVVDTMYLTIEPVVFGEGVRFLERKKENGKGEKGNAVDSGQMIDDRKIQDISFQLHELGFELVREAPLGDAGTVLMEYRRK